MTQDMFKAKKSKIPIFRGSEKTSDPARYPTARKYDRKDYLKAEFMISGLEHSKIDGMARKLVSDGFGNTSEAVSCPRLLVIAGIIEGRVNFEKKKRLPRFLMEIRIRKNPLADR